MWLRRAGVKVVASHSIVDGTDTAAALVDVQDDAAERPQASEERGPGTAGSREAVRPVLGRDPGLRVRIERTNHPVERGVFAALDVHLHQ